MERWENTRCHGREALTAGSAGSYHRSFSSSLLDAIYRSIDENGGGAGGGGQREGINDTVAAVGKQHSRAMVEERRRATTTSSQKAILSRRGPAAVNDLQPQRHHGRTQQWKPQRQHHTNSTSSSSESSYGGFSSSSDAEKPVAPLSTTPRPRPIRTSAPPEARKGTKLPKDSNKQRTEGSNIGERFRASKLYRELKKAKAPPSPGARLASFLNTLFAATGSTKKTKPAAGGVSGAAGDTSLCSSASSYTRTRLSRTPSSMGNATFGGSADSRRPIRFFPVSFAVDEDCRPRGHRCAYADQNPECFRRSCPPAAAAAKEAAEARRPTRATTREFIRGYEEKSRRSNGLYGNARDKSEAEGEEDDGAASYSSSDLFELENLAPIGAGGELPVYETTRLEANRAIAQGPGGQKKSS